MPGSYIITWLTKHLLYVDHIMSTSLDREVQSLLKAKDEQKMSDVHMRQFQSARILTHAQRLLHAEDRNLIGDKCEIGIENKFNSGSVQEQIEQNVM